MEFALEEIEVKDEDRNKNRIRCKTLDTIVKNPLGIHARPSALIVKKQAKYSKPVYLAILDEKLKPSEEKYACAEIMQMLIMEAHPNTKIRIYVEGEDEESESICKEMADLISSDFGEVY